MSSFLKSLVVDEVAIDAVQIVVATVAFTLLMEVFSYETVSGVWKQPKGKELYWQGWTLNLFNHIVLGIPIYVFAGSWWLVPVAPSNWKEFCFQVNYVMGLHAIQYYALHKAFHEYPTLYQWFHRFHHRYNVHTPPSAANAVTPGEYILAYVLPFVPVLLTQPISISAFKMASVIISTLNILVHTPKLEDLSKRVTPFFWVSTNNHLDHHRKLSMHYASPTYNIDNIVESIGRLTGSSPP
eukprot:Nitzschia sp. Nitz4//scaffold62_size106224//101382//102101//NITZ4_004374-RA/size106224-processed-gene-0.63-mRNA-1//-1//CDS//3329555910//1026//frame0